MALINHTPHSTQGIHHFPQRRVLVAEASELGLRPGQAWVQLYDDACDEGIVLRSHRTGAVTHWSLKSTTRSPDQEVMAWTLTPVTETLRRYPELQGYELRVLND